MTPQGDFAPAPAGIPDALVGVGNPEEAPMLYWAVMFFVLALAAGIFGFGGIAAGAATIGKILFVGFIVLAIASLVAGRRTLST